MEIETRNTEMVRVRMPLEMKQFLEEYTQGKDTDISKVIRSLVRNLKEVSA